MKKKQPIKREFLVQILRDDCNLLFVNNKEAKIICATLDAFMDLGGKCPYGKLLTKIKKQLGI